MATCTICSSFAHIEGEPEPVFADHEIIGDSGLCDVCCLEYESDAIESAEWDALSDEY